MIEKLHKQSITPPQRGSVGLSEFKKSLSDSKRRIKSTTIEENLSVHEENESFMMLKKANDGLNKSFSHFRSYTELIEMKSNIHIKADKHCKY